MPVGDRMLVATDRAASDQARLAAYAGRCGGVRPAACVLAPTMTFGAVVSSRAPWRAPDATRID